MRDIGIRVMNELVEPFRTINLDDTEFACLKAIVFFDPNARGLHDADKIRRLRHQIQVGVSFFTIRRRNTRSIKSDLYP